jgi:hypothetical protein
MRHSKIFLGITASLLALAGVAATRMQKNPNVIAYYFTNESFVSIHHCVQFGLRQSCWTSGSSFNCVTLLPNHIGGVSVYQLYYENNFFLGCRHPLYEVSD